MAVRNDFTAGEVLAAADLNDTFASKLDLAGGKILQIVRATDGTDRTTTSTSFVDVTGMSVTITPQKSDSAILLIGSFRGEVTAISGTIQALYAITDNSNNTISGSEEQNYQAAQTGGNIGAPVILIARATPATTAAVTYKLRFRVTNASNTATIKNTSNTGQMYAIEVSA